MKKQELLDDLAKTFHRLGKVAPVALSPEDTAIREAEGIRWYIAGVYENKDNRLIRRNIAFYVDHEGEGSELACYSDKLPSDVLADDPIVVFNGIVKTEIATYISSGVIEKGVVDTVSEEHEFAIVTVYMLDVGEIIIKRYFVYNDKDSTLQFKVIRD